MCLKEWLQEESRQQAVDTTEVAEADEIDALLESANDTVNQAERQNNPLFDLMVSPGFQGGPVLATFNIEDTVKSKAVFKYA